MTINGLSALNAYRMYGISTRNVQQSYRPLASGYRINSAADGAAELAISQGMRGQIAGLNKATQNATDGISMIQTADGALSSTSSVLTRMQELAVQATNGTYSDQDRALLDREFQQLKGQLDNVASSTHFNGQNLLDGSLGGRVGASGIESLGITGIEASAGSTFSGEAKFNITTENGVTSVTAQIGGQTVTNQIAAGDASTTFNFGAAGNLTLNFGDSGPVAGTINSVGVSGGNVNVAQAVSHSRDMVFQIGANGSADQRMSMNINDMSSVGLGLADLSISSLDGANSAIKAIQGAVDTVNAERANLGASQNRLESTVRNLGVTIENTTAAESRIRDTDMALAIMNLTQNSIQQQASLAMMAHSMTAARSNMLGLMMR